MQHRPAAAGADALVTPEAVVLEFETANVASRLLSGLIDVAIQAVLLFGLLFAAGLVVTAGVDVGGVGAAFVYVCIFLVIFGYPTAFETLWRGRTPGKAALGLRAVTVEGLPLRFRHAAIRAMLGLVDKLAATGLVGVLAILLTRRNQRLGDVVAGTIVLRERSAAKAPTAVVFNPPPGLEGYTASLDVAALGHADYGAARSLLLRAGALQPQVRAALAAQVAAPIAGRVRPTPPASLPPEAFLACVCAAYQRRFGARPGAAPASFSSVWERVDSPAGAPQPPPAAPPAPAPAGASGSSFAPPG